MVEKFTPTYDFELFFGPHPEDYFTPARIAVAERTFRTIVEEKKHGALSSMSEMVERLSRELSLLDPGKTVAGVMDNMYAQAFTIKCNAGMYGYPLATAFANQLFYYCKEVAGKPITKEILGCMRAHLDALRIIFKKDIRSMTDPAGLELLKELERIAEQFMHG